MKKNKFIVFLSLGGVLGFLLGFFVIVSNPKADEPSGTPSGIPAPSVYYDEKWEAEEVCYYAASATSSGYRCGRPANISGRIAGEIDYKDINIGTGAGIGVGAQTVSVPYVKYHPKVKVTKWKVQGHIHFP